jgi:putative phosphoribosyl transferase
MRFRDRRDAGSALATDLKAYADQAEVIVLALPRGGVPVGYEVAIALHVALDVILVRKLGVPGNEELAMGAIASGGVRVLNRDVIEGSGIATTTIDQVTAAEEMELRRREREYRDDRPTPIIADHVVILVDDGLATGATMRAGLLAIRQQQPRRLVAGVPVAPLSTCQELRAIADELVCVETPEPFYGVGLWYDDFAPTSDAEVRDLLRLAAGRALNQVTDSGGSPGFSDMR